MPAGPCGEKKWEDSSSQIPLMLFSTPAQSVQGVLSVAKEESCKAVVSHPRPSTWAFRNVITASNPSSLLSPFMAGSSLKAELGKEELIWSYVLSMVLPDCPEVEVAHLERGRPHYGRYAGSGQDA